MDYQDLINTGIRRLRKQKGLTQDKFAELIGLSVQGLRNLEQNKYQPTADTVDKICLTFKISPVDLLIDNQFDSKKDIINVINQKLHNSSTDELYRINDFIDLLRKKY